MTAGRFVGADIEVDAVRLPQVGDYDLREFFSWADVHKFEFYTSERDEAMVVETPYGEVLARPGDWIVKRSDGFFVIPDREFSMIYSPVAETFPHRDEDEIR